jgi:hypothetical protein
MGGGSNVKAPVVGVAGFQSGMSLAPKCTDVITMFWADFRNRSTLFHTCQILGDVSLRLMEVRSKLNRPQYLTDFLDPASIRVKSRWKLAAAEPSEVGKKEFRICADNMVIFSVYYID